MENTEQNPMNETIQTPVQPPKKTPWLNLLLLVLILSVLAVGAFYLKSKTLPEQPNDNPTEEPEVVEENTEEPLVSGMVEWRYPQPTGLDIFNPDAFTADAKFYAVGTFKQGQYLGQVLVVAVIPCEGPCPASVVRFVVKSDSDAVREPELVALKNHSDPLDNVNAFIVDASKYSVDSTTRIPDLQAPETLTGPKGEKLSTTVLGAFQASYNIFNSTNLVPVFFDSKVGQVYTTPDNKTGVDYFYGSYGFYVKMPDWNTAVYKADIDFVGTDNVPKVTWNDNSVNRDEYIYVNVGGCGSTDYAAVVEKSEVDITRDLKAAGKNANGETVYEFTNAEHPMLRAMYNDDYHPFDPETGRTDESMKVAYIEFVSSHPIFFWVDQFGRLIKFKNKRFIVSAAECGKPVIYLYPTKDQNVSVEVSPIGGFTFTEPEYGDGWNVFAKTNGELTNLSDGVSYPYLFWEGRGGLYQMPDKGFVVAHSDVSGFLKQKLSQLGLNAQESADFMEYWLPFFQGGKYYFVTFMGNEIMNRIAPLTVQPTPDTIIRVLMDFKPLTEPIEVEGYEIKTPVRKGFTVVEWGGVRP